MLEFLLFLTLTVAFLVGRLSRPVMADLKCGDAPPARFEDGLVIAWTGPVPSNAKISTVDSSTFDRVSSRIAAGSEPDTLDRRYTDGLFESDVFNSSIAWDLDEAVRWNERHGLGLGERPRELFGEYLETGRYVIFESLVDHPPVPNFEEFAVCSVAFQRADIYLLQGKEHLFLRSSFHSHGNDKSDFVNFRPSGGLRISFSTDTLWYPLRVTKLNGEPTSVVLNVFSERPFDVGELPYGFSVGARGSITTDVDRYAFTRLTATFEGGRDVPDLALKV